VYRVAAAFGFQQFNLSGSGDAQQWVAATTGLAAHQLHGLLRDAAWRWLATAPSSSSLRPSWAGGPQQQQSPVAPPASCATAQRAALGAWLAAIGDVHAEYFEQYSFWARQLHLPVSRLGGGRWHGSGS
jgi:hypothetical protein